MKRVNLTPELEEKKAEVMRQFHEADSAGGGSVRVGVPQTKQATRERSGGGAGDVGQVGDGEAVGGEELRERVLAQLKTIYDPEIPVNIYDLGLIYRVELRDGFAEVDMTLTTPGCPVAQTFPGMVESAVKMVPGISDAVVNLVWEPPWTQAMLSEAARLELGLV